jgi:hypothetical protein
MTAEPITYAKVGGPPHDWCGLRIFNEDTGAELDHVVEINAADGWLVRYAKDERGELILEGDALKKERVEGNFRIERP